MLDNGDDGMMLQVDEIEPEIVTQTPSPIMAAESQPTPAQVMPAVEDDGENFTQAQAV